MIYMCVMTSYTLSDKGHRNCHHLIIKVGIGSFQNALEILYILRMLIVMAIRIK